MTPNVDTIFDALPVALAKVDTSRRFVFANQAFARLFGWRAEDIVGRGAAELFDSEQYRTAGPRLEAALGGRQSGFEAQIVSADTGLRHLDVTCVADHGPEGSVTGCFLSITDVTDHKRIERLLSESEQRFQSLADSAPTMLWVSDANYACTFLSRGWYEYTAQAPDSGLGQGWTEAIHPDDRAAVWQAFCDAAERREPFQLDFRLRRADGQYRWVIDAGQPRFRPDGALQGYVGSVIDVHERKRTEERLRESEERFREMSDGLPLIVWVHAASGAQEFVNGTFCEFFGVTREEMKGGRWQMLVHPDDADAYLGEFERCVRARRPFHHEARVRRADGDWRWIESWGRPRFTSSGEFRGFVGTSADITARKQAEDALRRSEQALRESEERFRHLADVMPQLVWMASDDGTVTYYNSRVSQFRGLERDEAGCWHWEPAVHPRDLAATRAAWQAAVASGATYQCEHRLCMADGSYRWHLSRAYRLRGHDESSRWFGTATDIDQVKVAHEALREADRRKDEFLAMLGHELRNPLAAIQNATDLLKALELEEPRLQRVAGVLERQTMHMGRLIEGLLEVSRIARGKIQLECQPLDLRDVLQAVLHDRAREIAHRGLVLEKQWPDEPLWVYGDSVRLVQIVDNLAGNAIKFTDAPGVIHVELRKDGDHAVISVKDSGVGIRAESLSRIFEPFQQETQDMARAAGGLGLGLALAKGLVEMHRGAIEAHSAGLGAGTEFRVRLPLTSPPRPSTTPPAQTEMARRRILIVEDNADAAEMLRAILELGRHEVTCVNSGHDAMAHLRQRGADIVLCDLGLPDMNGYDIARAIRADPSLRHVILLALTGYGQPEDRKRTQEAGFDEHLVKPLDFQSLEGLLRRFGATLRAP